MRLCAYCSGTCPCGQLYRGEYIEALRDLELLEDAYRGQPLPPRVRDAWVQLVAELGAAKAPPMRPSPPSHFKVEGM